MLSTSTQVWNPVRVHLGDRGHEEVVDAPLLGELGVPRLVARVAVEVLERAELRRVDEHARDDDVALLPRARG